MEKYIKNFITDNDSICREERQYAVFLYDILRKYKDPSERAGEIQDIFTACSIPEGAEIKYVFYEPTFMRDFFERDRENGFNDKLLQYVYKDWPDIKSLVQNIENIEKNNLGRWLSKVEFKKLNAYINPKIKEIVQKYNEKKKDPEDPEKMIQHMMNIKPDIAVIYNAGEGNELLFLECKLESPERGNQRAIHWLVADFLCGYLKEKEESIEVAKAMKEEEKSCLVKFVREKVQEIEKKEKKKPQKIEIEKLIAYSYYSPYLPQK